MGNDAGGGEGAGEEDEAGVSEPEECLKSDIADIEGRGIGDGVVVVSSAVGGTREVYRRRATRARDC